MLIVDEGFDCSSSNILPLNTAAQVLGKEKPDLIAAVLEPNPERALAVILSMKGQGPVHVLAIGPAVDTKLVLRVLRAGADDYVDSASLETELKDALRRWRAKVTKTTATGKLISLISPNGGCGVSTLAVNLAVALAEHARASAARRPASQHRRSGVAARLEADLLDCQPLPDLSGIDHSLFEKALTPHESGVQLLAPPRRIEDAATVTPRGVCQVLVMARSEFPFVVVDLDVDSGDTMQEVLIQSDLILLVLKPDVISLRNAKRLLGRLEWLGISPLSIRTVLSRVGQPGEVATAKVEAALRTKIFHVMPEDFKVVNNCNNMGVPATKEAPRSRFASAVNAWYRKSTTCSPRPPHRSGRLARPSSRRKAPQP